MGHQIIKKKKLNTIVFESTNIIILLVVNKLNTISILSNLLASASVVKYLIIMCCHRGTFHARKTREFNTSIVLNIFSGVVKLFQNFFNAAKLP